MRKKVILLLLLFLLSACSNEKSNEEIPILNGIKPVIYYEEQLYWMSIDYPIDKLPSNYIDSGNEIVDYEKDPTTIPSKECFTSTMNSNNVGADIFIDPDDTNSIIIFTGTRYIVFTNEKKEME